MASDEHIQQEAQRLRTILDLDPHGLSRYLVDAAGGHDARMELINTALSLARCVALDVMLDMEAQAHGYGVCNQTGEASAGTIHHGDADEERALVFHLYATAQAAEKCVDALCNTQTRFSKNWAKADKAPNSLTADKYLQKISKLK